MIPYGRQDIRPEDIAAVSAVLQSDFLTQGPAVPRFEAAVAAYAGASHAIAVNSATSALHIACLALDLGPGDRLWTSPNTFVASANCALYCGATVDFVDVDPINGNLCPQALAAKLRSAEAQGCLPKVLVAVHFSGYPADLAAIAELTRRYGIRLIEDASHAIGGRYAGEPIGNGRYSDITIFSFHPVKIVTTGEGGMALTNDAELAHRMALLRSHGITRDSDRMEQDNDGPWYYEQITLGFNYRMTDMQAALGLSQLDRLDEYVARRHALAHRYDAAFADLPLRLAKHEAQHYSGMHLYVIRLATEALAVDRRTVFERLRAAGIGVNVHYIPVHVQPHYRRLGFCPGDFPRAEQHYAEAISLPLFPNLTEAQQDKVIDAVRTALKP